jgi:hypothetical protein
MVTSDMLCLASSPKENACCIARIDLATRRFVRPVADGAQAIPNDWGSEGVRNLCVDRMTAVW